MPFRRAVDLVVDLAHRELLDRWPRALLRNEATCSLCSFQLATRRRRKRLESASRRLANASVPSSAGQARPSALAAGLPGRGTSWVRNSKRSRPPASASVSGGDRTLSFDELGVYRVIARVEEQQRWNRFGASYLALSRLRWPPRYRVGGDAGGLLRLQREPCQSGRAAAFAPQHAALPLERVEALTGHDLDDSDTRLALQLALKIRRVFPTLSASQARMTRGARM